MASCGKCDWWVMTPAGMYDLHNSGVCTYEPPGGYPKCVSDMDRTMEPDQGAKCPQFRKRIEQE